MFNRDLAYSGFRPSFESREGGDDLVIPISAAICTDVSASSLTNLYRCRYGIYPPRTRVTEPRPRLNLLILTLSSE